MFWCGLPGLIIDSVNTQRCHFLCLGDGLPGTNILLGQGVHTRTQVNPESTLTVPSIGPIWLGCLSDSSRLSIYWSSVETLFLLFSMSMWTTTVLLGLVVVPSMFAVNSLHLACSVLRQLCAPAESTLMFRAFPLFLRTARAIIPRAARHASTRTHTLVVSFWFSYSYCICVQRWLPEG